MPDSSQHHLKHDSSGFVKKGYIIILVIAVCVFCLFLILVHSSVQMNIINAPLVDAVMEIKLETTTAHLWLEEILSGDRDEQMLPKVWKHLDNADWYAGALLEGGDNVEGRFYPVSDEEARKDVEDIVAKLKEFRAATKQRLATPATSFPGSNIDQKYDYAFQMFLLQVDKVETSLQRRINQLQHRFQQIEYAIFIILFLTFAGSAIAYRHYEKQRDAAFQQLDKQRNDAEEREEKWSITMKSMGDAVIITDNHGRINYLNPIAEELTGWSLAEATGEEVDKVFKIVNAKTRQTVESPVEKVVRSGAIVGLANHTVLISKTGKELQIADSGAPIRDHDGELHGVVLIFRDVTEKYRTNQSLYESEATLKSIFRAAPTGIGMVNNRILIQINDRITEMTGYAAGELLNQSARMLYPSQEEYERVGKEKYQQISEHGTGTVETVWKKKDGTLIEVLLSSTPLDINDLNKGVTFTALDITKRKRTERELLKFKTISDRANYGAAILSMDQTVIYSNERFASMHGLFVNELMDQSIFEVYQNNQKQQLTNLIRNAKEGVEITGQEVRFTRKDGTILIALLAVSMITTGNGDDSFIVLTAIDVTEQYKIEEQLRQSQKMDSLGRLAGGIAHDFNNMLSGIIGYAEMLNKKQLKPEEFTRSTEAILKAATRASDLTAKLLSFSRKGREETTLIDMHQLIRETVSLLQRTIDRRIKILEFLDARNANVNGDPSQLQNILLNLGVNARDAIEGDGTITFASETVSIDESSTIIDTFKVKPGRFLKIQVSDTGVGMDEDILEKIFEPFFTTKEVGKGTGLGLAAVYGAIRDHHGAVTVRSRPGKGTVFSMFLPIAENLVQAESTDENKRSGQDKLILLVDDEEIIRIMMADLLESLGFRVLVADNGQAGLDLFLENRDQVDLVILDVVMPIMNGKDCFLKIRENKPDMPVVFCSGYSRDAGIEEILRGYQHTGYIKKPFEQDELLDMLFRQLSS